MQKFTVFSIVLSLVVVLTMTDVLFHGYLTDEETPSETIETPELPSSDPASADPQGEVTELAPSTETPSETPPVELQEEKLPSVLSVELMKQAGFLTPILKEAPFSGLVFQFLSVDPNPEATAYQWNFFEETSYTGSFYEEVFPTETGAFQAYLALREAAQASGLGTVNEVNNYGDASFYFNHSTKTKTVYLVMHTQNRVIAFEYAQEVHEKMKKLFDILKTLQ